MRVNRVYLTDESEDTLSEPEAEKTLLFAIELDRRMSRLIRGRQRDERYVVVTTEIEMDQQQWGLLPILTPSV